MLFYQKILLLLFLLSSNYIIAQDSLYTTLTAAKDDLEDKKIRLSEKHIDYQQAALHYATLIYQNPDNWDDASIYARPAIKFIYTKYGPKSPIYAQSLKKIPNILARIFDGEIQLEQIVATIGKNNKEYAKVAIRLAHAHLDNEDYDGYPMIVEAFRVLDVIDYPKEGYLYNFADEHIPPYLIDLAKAQINLEKISKLYPNSTKQIDALLEMSNFVSIYSDNSDVDFYEDDLYQYLTQAISIAATIDDPKRKEKAAKLFTEEMKTFYPIEKNYYTYLAQNNPPNDDLIIEFRTYLNAIDSFSIGEASVLDVCNELKNRIEKKYTTENSYYLIIDAICTNWYLDEEEERINVQKIVVATTLEKHGNSSEKYAKELLKMAAYYADYGDEDLTLKYYIKAFETLEDIDTWGEFDLAVLEIEPLDLDSLDWDNIDIDFNPEIDSTPKDTVVKAEVPIEKFREYLNKVPPPWNIIIQNEFNIRAFLYTEDRTGVFLANAYFKAGWDYFQFDILTDRAENYYKKAIEKLSSNHKYIATEWLDKLFRLDPEYAPPEYASIIGANLSLIQVMKLMEFPLDSIEKRYTKESSEYCNLREIIADAYFFDNTQPYAADSALAIYNECLEVYINIDGNNFNYKNLLSKITDLLRRYESPWHVDIASHFFDLLLDARKDGYASYYTQSVKKYADWHYNNNRFVAAEPLYKEYFRLIKPSPKKQDKIYFVESLYNIARIYRKTGRYQIALQTYEQTKELSKKLQNSLLYIHCLDDLGLLYQHFDVYDKAAANFEESLAYLTDLDNSPNSRFKSKQTALLYIKVKRHIGKLAYIQEDYDKALKQYTEIRKFENTSDYVSFYKDYSLKRDLALLNDKLGNIQKAKKYYKLAIKQLSDNDELADALINFAAFYARRDSTQKATEYYLTALDLDITQIDLNYPNLSEEERLLFLSPIKERINQFLSFVSKNPTDTLTIIALNANLMIKGLALENTNNIKEAIVNSDNVLLNELNEDLLLLRKKIANAATISVEKRKKRGLDLTDLKAQVKNLEKKLSRESKDLRLAFDKQNKQLDYQQLKDTLTSNAAAIDFFTINQEDDYGDLVTNYYAIVIKKNSPAPILVKLATEEDLSYVLDNEVAPNSINYITDELESHYLYQLIWQPLLVHIDTLKELYLCPSGILSKIAFNTLLINANNKQRIMDKWSLHYYSSFRDMLKQPITNITKRIALIGGVQFSLTSEQLSQLADDKKLTTEAKKELLSPPSLASTNRGSRGEDFGYLPGTLQEVKAIQELFETKGWKADMLTGENALEENIAKIDDTSPDILHIATHGFFFSGSDESGDFLNTKKQKVSVENRIATNKDPLLRSGLAMTGINVIWQDGKEIAGMEDGILFAKEVAGMNLFETELVVLSACETGRGDIDNDEGIMGLQRAFKTAGAHKLVISLWKVPDQQTSELMQLFYAAYLENNDAHKSFELAQHTMKNKYKNPYYWAAFLLIE